MLKCFREALSLAYENLICVSPLLLFMIAVSLYLNSARVSIVNLFSLILSIITLIIIFSIFLSGWFYMIKMAIINTRFNMMNLKKDFELLKIFPTGVADYFLPFVSYIICYIALISIIFFFDYLIAIKFIGKTGIVFAELLRINSYDDLRAIFFDLTYAQIIKFSGWCFLYVVSILIYSLFTLMWIPYLMFKTKNVFKALYYSIVDVFSSPKIVTLLLCLVIINFIFAIINSYIILNPILYFIMTIAYVFFIVQMSMLTFLYYDRKYTYENEN